MVHRITKQGFPYRKRRYLVVNLDKGSFSYEELDRKTGRNTMGGRALALELWDRWSEPSVQEKTLFDEGNPIVIAPGCCSTVLSLPAQGYAIVTKSPVTGNIAIGCGSGPFSDAFSAVGVDAIVFLGRQNRLCLVEITDSSIAFHVDETLHGLRTEEVADEKISGQGHILSVGPAAERGVPEASVLCDGENVGREGIGLVFAQKNVKGVFLRGSGEKRKSYSDGEAAFFSQSLSRVPAPPNPYDAGARGGWIALSGFSDFTDGRLWAIRKATDRWVKRIALGPNLGLFSSARIDALLDICDSIGLDPISAGMVLANEISQGKVDKEHLGEELGKLGKDASLGLFDRGDGVGLLPFDLRAVPGMALLSTLGDDIVPCRLLQDHVKGRDAARFILMEQLLCRVGQSLGLDEIHSIKPKREWKLMVLAAEASEGHPCTVEDLLALGMRTMEKEKEIAVRLRARTSLPVPRFFQVEPMQGDKEGRVVRIARLADDYGLAYDQAREMLVSTRSR